MVHPQSLTAAVDAPFRQRQGGLVPRWFNIAGPCYADEHFMIPPEGRAAAALPLIEQGRWFSLVAGRQTGKTTVLKYLAQKLNAEGRFYALAVDLETARDQEDIGVVLALILGRLDVALGRVVPAARLGPEVYQAFLALPQEALVHYLNRVCAASDKPLVILFDEADVLKGPAMVSFLTQLRALYLDRKESAAPHSVVLTGVRSVRDYVANNAQNQVTWLGSASPFNITVENVSLAAFTEAEVAELTAQHTAETGQIFTAEANQKIYDLSAGHPWLVNALADQASRRDVTDRKIAITAQHIEAAKETIILERRTHIDSLLARLREPRVQRVLEPMLVGSYWPPTGLDDDVAYVATLGLICKVGGHYQIANPIYREVIPRALNATIQMSLPHTSAWYLDSVGNLDMPKLMVGWQNFWRQDGHLAAEGFGYRESGPHLMLMAFLQRIVNGGGQIEREYALGKRALDLLITWKQQKIPIEVKLRRDTETEADALTQVARYLDSLNTTEGWLVFFDLRAQTPWSERLFIRTESCGGKTIHIVGC